MATTILALVLLNKLDNDLIFTPQVYRSQRKVFRFLYEAREVMSLNIGQQDKKTLIRAGVGAWGG